MAWPIFWAVEPLEAVRVIAPVRQRVPTNTIVKKNDTAWSADK